MNHDSFFSSKLLHFIQTLSSITYSLKQTLMKPTLLFGAKLWIFIVILIVLFTLLVIILTLFVTCTIKYLRGHKRYDNETCVQTHISHMASKLPHNPYGLLSFPNRRLLSLNMSEIEMNKWKVGHSDQLSSSGVTPTSSSKVSVMGSMCVPMVKDVWRGDKFTLRELEAATNGFGKENLIGNGDYGIVYHGVLFDNTRVAVKRLVSGGCHENDFVTEMEAAGHSRHKNLVKLLGYRIERAYRLVVHEYVDNRSLHYWLHECPSNVSPLTWDIRLKIIQGIAKGLTYLHEDIEPNIFHRTLVSSNVLLDQQWEPKLSDFGLAKLYTPAWGITIMDSLGYVSPEYFATVNFDEKADVYSFGILVMEIICGRTPIDRTQGQPYLIDWLKSMVASQTTACLVDPKLIEKPSSKELKRLLLVSLRCVDTNIKDWPRIGEVLHMIPRSC